MADSLELKEVELDYEAEEIEDRTDTPTPRVETPNQGGEIDNTVKENNGKQEEDNNTNTNGDSTKLDLPDVSTDLISSPSQEGELDDDDDEGIQETDTSKGDGEIESGEELEDGEISDEDEALKNERLEPKAVCRFFSKGQCTWGSSCRFLHPGVLDKGNYSMFAAPRPILPGESGEDAEVVRKEEAVMVPPPVAEHESAWERGMRQAKEMRRRSSKRREMDVEYEEKKTSQSLTQVELDKENDYYTRPASPAHTHDPHAEEGDYYNDKDPYDTYHPEVRRIAPPPPPEFIAREERERSRYHNYPPAPGPPRPRRIAPPRSPSPGPGTRERFAPPPPPSHHHGPGGGRFKGGEDWADPWMRGGPDRRQGGGGGRPVDRYGRKRSYSSGSSRSSSGSSRSRSPRRRRRYSSSYSSRSSSRSRSRSSTPAGIPRREGGARGVKKEGGAGGSGRSTAPLQKRLAGAGAGAGVTQGHHRHRDRRSRDDSSEDEGDKSKSGQENKGERSKDVKKDKPREPFKMNISKNQIKLSLKGAGSSKPTANSAVLEKLGVTKDDFEEKRKSVKRKSDESTEAIRQQQKLASMKSKIDAISKSAEKIKSEKVPDDNPADNKKMKVGNEETVEEGLAGADTKNRREELLKQLRAVEKAIHKKRSKLDK